MNRVILYIHGKFGNPNEAERFRAFCPGYDIIGSDYPAETPWENKSKLLCDFENAARKREKTVILANSIGAFFAMDALCHCNIDKALFISPILDMEKLISGMMASCGITEDELRTRGSIVTPSGEVLSRKYLSYVRDNKPQWKIPTEILYAGNDNLTDRATVDSFVAGHNAKLTVMGNGEHWFHTDEQVAFLTEWLKASLCSL